MPPSASSEPPALSVRGLSLRYGPPGREAEVLAVPALTLAPGAQLCITGPSGSGKSSLLHILTGIERPSAGSVAWGGLDLATAGEGARDAWRRRHVGLVFQNFHLVPQLSALENVLLPWRFDRWRVPPGERERAADLLRGMGLGEPRRRAGLLSRGEQQRTAIARALVRRPAILVADEPTASLDAEAGERIGDLLLDAAAQTGTTLIVVTHDPALQARIGAVLRLAGGRPVAAEAGA